MPSENEACKNALDILNPKLDSWRHYKNQNRQGAYFISGAIIIFGLLSTVINLTNMKDKALLAGVSSAIVVAAQACDEKFKFKTMEEKYRKAQKDLDTLITTIKLDPEHIDMEAIKKKLEEISDL